MANVTESPTYDAGVYQIETADPVQGGATGVSNYQAKNLANRTAYLKQHVDNLESGATIPPTVAPLASPALTGSPTAPTQALGDNSTKIATTAFVQATVGGRLAKSVAGGVNVSLTAVEAGNALLEFTGTLTANIAVIVPTSPTRAWVVKNSTSGSFTLTVKTAAGTGVVVTQGSSNAVFTDGTNVYGCVTDFNNLALTGVPTAPTASAGTNSNQIATTAYADAIAALKANIASPAFTGTPTAPTPAVGDSSTKLATMAAVYSAADGMATVSVASGTDVTLTQAQYGNAILNLTGTPSAAINLIFPAQTGQWIIANNQGGTNNITAKTAAGTGKVIPQGQAVLIYCDGTNIGFASAAGTASFRSVSISSVTGTTLTVSGGYTAGAILLEKNGALLEPSDYTASNGSTITLNTAAVSADKFTVYVFNTFTVANAVQKSGDTMSGALNLPSNGLNVGSGQLAVSGGVVTTNIPLSVGGNVALSATQSAWDASMRVVELKTPGNAVFAGGIANMQVSANVYWNGANFIYANNGVASMYKMDSGTHYWFSAISGLAGNIASMIQIMMLDASGNLSCAGKASAGADATNPSDLVRFNQYGTRNFGGNGYQKFPSGLIIQWGVGTANNGDTINFPISFPGSVLNVNVMSRTALGVYSTAHSVSGSESNSGFQYDSSNVSNGRGYYYIAIGY